MIATEPAQEIEPYPHRWRDAIGAGLIGVVLSLPALIAPLNQYDGGLVPAAATFLVHGEMPYVDFWWLYGPAGPALLAPIVAVFGSSLLVIRLVGLAIAFWLAAVGYAWIRTRVPFVLAILIPATTVGFMTFVTGAEPSAWFMSMAFAMSGVYVRVFHPRQPVLAGVLIALSTLTRLDLGAYAFIVTALVPERRRFVATVGVIGLIPVAVTVATSGLPLLFDQLIWYPLVGPRQFRGVPIPRITDALTALAFILAVMIPKAGVLVAMTQMIVGPRPQRSLMVLTVFAALCQLQTAGRSDFQHQVQGGFPGTLLLAYALGGMWGLPRWRPSSVGAPRLLALAVLAGVCGFNLSFSVIGLQTAELRSLRPDEEAFLAAVRTIVDSTNRDDPIFVGLTSNRTTFANDMLAYYFANRRSGVRVAMFNPGVTNTDQVQREMVTDLESSGTRFALLDDHWAKTVELTNDSSIPGSTKLDKYLSSQFVAACDYGTIHVLVRKGTRAVLCAHIINESMSDILLGQRRP